MIRTRWALPAATVLAAASLSIMATNGSAAARTPTVGLVRVLHHLDVTRYRGDKVLYLSPGIYATAISGAFEVDESRAADGSFTFWQVRRGTDGAIHRVRKIQPHGPAKWGRGLPGFFVLKLRDSSGTTISSTLLPFCPSGNFGLARTNFHGPNRPAYPSGCGDSLTKAMPLGLDEGWAAEVGGEVPYPRHTPDGDYTLRIAIAKTYAQQLEVPADEAAVRTHLTVKTRHTGGCTDICPPPPTGRTNPATRGEGAGGAAATTTGGVGTTDPGTTGDGVPDLRALPAHHLRVDHDSTSNRDYLDFAATIWNAGTGPLVVEGYRAGDQPVMTSRQFIYQDGEPVRSQVVGQFEYDTRHGHHHWHMEDIAQYDLLDASGNRIELSEKQSFCLAPTDPIDLTGPDADWQPDTTGLWSACAGEDSIWLREVLSTGWGDTYYQSVAGQSFNITDLPNGSYFLRVTADPNDKLIETDYSNNAALLPIELHGPASARTVTIGH